MYSNSATSRLALNLGSSSVPPSLALVRLAYVSSKMFCPRQDLRLDGDAMRRASYVPRRWDGKKKENARRGAARKTQRAKTQCCKSATAELSAHFPAPVCWIATTETSRRLAGRQHPH